MIRSAEDYLREGGKTDSELAQADTQVLTLRVSADKIPSCGELVDIVPNSDRIHLFDSVTGVSLRSVGAP